MSVAYFIVIDNDEVGIDTFVNGKNIAQAYDDLNSFCEKNDLKKVEDFHSQAVEDYVLEMDDIDIPAQDIEWFSAAEGIEWVSALITKLESGSAGFNAKPVIEDLNEYLEVFRQCSKAKVKWHLEMDF